MNLSEACQMHSGRLLGALWGTLKALTIKTLSETCPSAVNVQTRGFTVSMYCPGAIE
jgi:hypothetical protein